MNDEIYTMRECALCRKTTSGQCAYHLQSGKIDDKYFTVRLDKKAMDALIQAIVRWRTAHD